MSSTRRNRAFWNATSDAYQARHGAALAANAMAWGVWRIPESELGILGHVQGCAVLELGCDAAQWTHALIRVGGRAIGLDISEQQLAHARVLSRSAGVRVPLIQGGAEQLPFRNEVFDIVFCDHGATVFTPPEVTIEEVSRVLKPGGMFAFCMSTPIRDVCIGPQTGQVRSKLTADYFRLAIIDDG